MSIMENTDRDAPSRNKVELQQVLGLTVCNNSAIDNDPQTSTVAYPAGCVVVLYNVRKNKQKYIINHAKKSISCLSFSWDGRYLATGECGALSHLRVWDVNKQTEVADLSGHKHGINCVAFSPNMKYVVSVGSQHDMIVNVWDWRTKVKVASNKVSCKVKALSFSAGGNYFVTVGNNHVKFWYLEYSRSTKYKLEPVPLMGRSAILGDQRNNYFCDVACGRGESADSTFAITKSGLLCEFNNRRLLDKWVELRITTAVSISVGESFIFIGCSEGTVRCFSPLDLHFICTLPRPHCLGVDVAKGLIGRQTNPRISAPKYPDVIAVTLDETNKKVTCVHNDHSIYIWDIRDIKKIGKSHSFLFHSACIWGIEIYPELAETEGCLPPGTFFTCANDDTVRIWNLETGANSTVKRNIYCQELLKILYTDPTYTSLCNIDLLPTGTNDKENAYDGKNGVRCLKVRPGGEHLASGDRAGNIRVYDLKYMETVCKVEAHDSEVLCLEYSNCTKEDNCQLLSSASRDRLIHIFNAGDNYAFLQTLDDHTSAVTATKFIKCRNELHLVSCGADKSVIFRKSSMSPKPKIIPEHSLTEKTTFYDMEVDVSRNYILTACQDSKIRVYDVVNGKHARTMSGAQEDGTLIKIAIDSSGSFVATSSTDKNVYIYDYTSGQCVASMTGHSELVTGLKFMPSRKQLISVSGDGCIFVWKLPPQISKGSSKGINSSGIWNDAGKNAVAVTKPFQPELKNHTNDSNVVPYQFNIGQLPAWAKKQIQEDGKQGNSLSKSATQPIMEPRGRWAQRLDGQSLVVKSYLHADAVIPYPNTQGEQHTEHTTIKYTTTESRNLINVREETISQTQQISISRSSLIQENDSGPSSLTSNSKRERVRHATDSSSASSHRCDDGDAEDERSDSGATENSEMVFYPPFEEGSETKDSSFHICAVKDEKPNSYSKRGLMHSHSSYNFGEKTDAVSDGDDSSSNQAVPLSSLSMSTENLDRLDQREKFMLNNYESLNKEPSDEEYLQNRFSISSKYHSKSVYVATPTSGRETPNHLSSSKRDELTKALNDARKKLETLGYKGNLSTSKSVGDLRNVSENDDVLSRLTAVKGDSNDMRRSTSYGDISLRNSAPRRRLPSTPQPGSQHAPLWAQAKSPHYSTEPSDSDSSRQFRLEARNRNLRHSSSATSLVFPSEQSSPQQQSKQTLPNNELKAPFATSFDNPPQRSISSLNKSQSVLSVNTLGSNKNTNSGGSRRLSLTGAVRRLQYDDSSSSEASPTDTKSNTIVPRGIVARRMKAFCTETSANRAPTSDGKSKRSKGDREPTKSKSDWDLRDIHLEKERPRQKIFGKINDAEFGKDEVRVQNLTEAQARAEYIKNLEPSPMDLPVRDTAPANSATYMDIHSTPLSQDLCDKVSEELKRTTSFAMQLFQRITVDPHLTPTEKSSMTTTLAQGVWQAQNNLQPAASQVKTPKPDLSDPTVAMNLLQQYSDKLLSMVEQRITKADKH